MKQASILCSIPLAGGGNTHIKYDFDVMVETLAERGEADFAIVSTEDGFSPLGASGNFFEHDLGLSYSEDISRIARWNLEKNKNVTLVSLQTKNPSGFLRGVILAPGENCVSYKPYASFSTNHRHSGRPHRDYYYSITYEAIANACIKLGARRLAISHLSGSGRFHQDMATCHAEALLHFCRRFPEIAPESFTFYGCCISSDKLNGAKALIESDPKGYHRPIDVHETFKGAARLLTLDWSMDWFTGLQKTKF
jgi:hypothetical protein